MSDQRPTVYLELDLEAARLLVGGGMRAQAVRAAMMAGLRGRRRIFGENAAGRAYRSALELRRALDVPVYVEGLSLPNEEI